MKNGPKRNNTPLVESIYQAVTNQSILKKETLDSLGDMVENYNHLRAITHLVESYTIGYRILPEIFLNFPDLHHFVYMYSKLQGNNGKNANILKNALANFLIEAIDAGEKKPEFLSFVCGSVLEDYKSCFLPSLLTLSQKIAVPGSAMDASHIQRLQFIISNMIVPSTDRVMVADENVELATEFLKLMRMMCNENFVVAFPLIMSSNAYNAIINSILCALNSIWEVSLEALSVLIILYRHCLSNSIFDFFIRFYLPTVENALGLVFDKDMRNNYDAQVELLFNLISYLPLFPSLNNADDNAAITRDFINDLFVKNFRNLTSNAVSLFVRGLFEIKKIELFKAHLNDFNVKINEFGNDEEFDAECALLKERITKSIQ